MTTPPSLVEELLADQQHFTAVDQFSRAHDDHALGPAARYRNLIPLEAPRSGEQYAFEVQLDKCSGCKACVTACHSLNGLDDNETWREVGLLFSEPKRHSDRFGGTSFTRPSLLDQPGTRGTRPSSVAQHVTTACHHCVDPACLNGCPVLAYEKDPVTGIVRHLDDQCIGCQYCVLKCPYDVPKFNRRLGIVRKCDMCSNRLSAGEEPACVQACPNEAIRITKVRTDAVRIAFRERHENFLSGAPAGEYTLPTTRYLRTEPDLGKAMLMAADARELKPQPTHWPLVMLLVLSQASVGASCVAAFAGGSSPLLWLALALGVASVAASTLHLGRPLGAWRFFLGLKRSWLSREILAFSLFIPMLVTALIVARSTEERAAPPSLNAESGRATLSSARRATHWNTATAASHARRGEDTVALPSSGVHGVKVQRFVSEKSLPGEERGNQARMAATATGAVIGLLGVFCSMMIYHDTRRVLWNGRRSAALFFGTTALLGLSAWFALHSANALALAALVGAAVAKLAVEISVLRHAAAHELTSLKKSALLIAGRFQHTAFARMLCIMLGGIGLPLLLHAGAFASNHTSIAWLAFVFVLAGEIGERILFFRTVDAPKMPGGLPS